MDKNEIFKLIDDNKDLLVNTAKKLWEKPETSLNEEKSSKLQMNILKEEGFSIEENVGDMPTAFVAEYGNGKPILGVLGEYDALAGMSQKVKANREPIIKGEPGHGCGHNLLGTAGIGAVLAIKEAIDKGEIEGTIRYYGCPAEETLTGKVFMARDGVFDDLDSAITWHPMQANSVWSSSSLAMNSVRFNFEGQAAHASSSPEMGRSALDAVELMNVGVNYLREHVNEKARIHYSITNGGGSPNIVPDAASVWYYIRAPKREEVEEIFERIKKIAKGATMMTETEVDWKFQAACYDVLANEKLGEVITSNMKEIGGPDFDKKEKEFAEELAKSFDKGQKKKVMGGAPEEVIEQSLHGDVIEPYDKGEVMSGSTDVGDVSWITPLAQFTAATWPVGTAVHTWQAVAASGSSIGHKAMIFSSKTLAGTLFDLYQDPELIDEAKEEFKENTKEKDYKTPLPENVEPPFDQFDK